MHVRIKQMQSSDHIILVLLDYHLSCSIKNTPGLVGGGGKLVIIILTCAHEELVEWKGC